MLCLSLEIETDTWPKCFIDSTGKHKCIFTFWVTLASGGRGWAWQMRHTQIVRACVCVCVFSLLGLLAVRGIAVNSQLKCATCRQPTKCQPLTFSTVHRNPSKSWPINNAGRTSKGHPMIDGRDPREVGSSDRYSAYQKIAMSELFKTR